MPSLKRLGLIVCGAVALVPCASVAPASDIVETVAKQRDLSTLAKAIKAAGLADSLKGPGPFTLFAPTNAAFDKLPKGTLDALMEPKNKEKLAALLKYHLLSGSHTSTDVANMRNGTMIRTIEGRRITITRTRSGVYINGAKVTVTDIKASNGVIHMIDAVLIPPKP